MKARKALPEETDKIFEIYANARKFMSENGNPTQWDNGYPDKLTVKDDIESDRLYVIEEDGNLLCVFSVFSDGETDYDNIEGAWLNSLPYIALHRVASAGKRGGMVAECVSFVMREFNCNDIRIDTHENNIPMKRSLERIGFIRCGKVNITRAGERIAYHLHV